MYGIFAGNKSIYKFGAIKVQNTFCIRSIYKFVLFYVTISITFSACNQTADAPSSRQMSPSIAAVASPTPNVTPSSTSAPTPSILSVSPAYATSAGGKTVTITGKNLNSDINIFFGSNKCSSTLGTAINCLIKE